MSDQRLADAADLNLGTGRSRLWWVADAVGGEDVWGTGSSAAAIRSRIVESLNCRAREITQLIEAVATLEGPP